MGLGEEIAGAAIKAALPFPLNLLASGLGWLRSALSALAGFIVRNPWQAAVIALAVACAWLWRADRRTHDALAQNKAAFASYVSGVKRAEAENAAKAKEQAADTAQVQGGRNRSVADVEARIEAERADAVAAYAAAHRVRGPDAGCVGTAATAAVPDDPGKPDQGLPAADMVAVSRADLDKLTQGALQNAVKRGFLQSLVDSGQAVVVSDGG